MAIKNFWIEGNLTDKKTQLTGGPRSKDGGFDIIIKMRSEKHIITALYIQGYVNLDGKLTLVANDRTDNDRELLRMTTER